MNRMNTIKDIEANKIIVVTRGIYSNELLQLAKALTKGGIHCFEITYDQADPQTLIKVKTDIQRLHKEFGEQLILGVGTVLTSEQVINAKEAGAQFIVSPNYNYQVVRETKRQELVSIPGAMTPTEICEADQAGADFIKLFPAGTLGLKYCKDIFAPIHHVKFIATVGVTEEIFEEYLKLGFIGAGISSRLVDPKLRQAKKYDELTNRAERFVEIAKKY